VSDEYITGGQVSYGHVVVELKAQTVYIGAAVYAAVGVVSTASWVRVSRLFQHATFWRVNRTRLTANDCAGVQASDRPYRA
jgi:hypothetical protein